MTHHIYHIIAANENNIGGREQPGCEREALLAYIGREPPGRAASERHYECYTLAFPWTPPKPPISPFSSSYVRLSISAPATGRLTLATMR